MPTVLRWGPYRASFDSNGDYILYTTNTMGSP